MTGAAKRGLGVESVFRVQELCESRGGRSGAFRPNEPYGFRGRKAILTMLTHWSQLVPNMSTDIRGQHQKEWNPSFYCRPVFSFLNCLLVRYLFLV